MWTGLILWHTQTMHIKNHRGVQVWDSMTLNSLYQEINPLQLWCIPKIFYTPLLVLKADNSVTCSQRKMSTFGLEVEVTEFVSEVNTK